MRLVPSLVVEHATGPAACAGGPASSTGDGPRRRSGGALDAERPIVAAACGCPRQVASARRQSVCPRCGAPVIQTIQRNAPAAIARPGADNTEVPVMCRTPYNPGDDALAALAAEVRCGGRSVEVACPDDDCGHPLLLVDDSHPRYDGWGRPQHEERIVVIEPGHEHDPESGELSRCPGCLDEIAPDMMVLRDRHRRCEQALAEAA